MSKPRLLIIGHTYVSAFNRRKLDPLCESFEITCVTRPLHDQKHFGGPLTEQPEVDSSTPYDLIRLPIWPRGAKPTGYLHRGLMRLLHERTFDLVLVDAEPWSLIRWQTWMLLRCIQPGACFGEFSWENVERPGLKGLILGWVYRLATRTHHFSISGNSAGRQIFLRYGANPESNRVAAQIGVDEHEFYPATSNEKVLLRREIALPDSGFLLGFCGRLTEEKGLRELVEAVERLRKNHPALEVHLVLMGEGAMKGELSDLALRRSWLHLLPPCAHSQVPAFIRCLDVFVLPSKPQKSRRGVWEEQFGHVLIEAMASEVLTLGSSSGAIPEVIGMPEAIFQHSDVEALTRILERWMLNESGRLNLAKAQRSRALQHYTHDALARVWSTFLLERLPAALLS